MKISKEKALLTLGKARELLRTSFVVGSWISIEDEFGEYDEWTPGGHVSPSQKLQDLIPREILSANSHQVCGEGAVYLAAAREGLTVGDAQDLIRLLEEDPKVMGYADGSIPEYNDSEGTPRKMMNVVDRTMKRIEAEEPV